MADSWKRQWRTSISEESTQRPEKNELEDYASALRKSHGMRLGLQSQPSSRAAEQTAGKKSEDQAKLLRREWIENWRSGLQGSALHERNQAGSHVRESQPRKNHGR
jgi:hypothetical protein